MNLVNQSFWIFIAIIVSLALVAFKPGLLSMGAFLTLTNGLLIYQVIITLKDDSDNLEEELAEISDEFQ